jgi:hypothetical protein
MCTTFSLLHVVYYLGGIVSEAAPDSSQSYRALLEMWHRLLGLETKSSMFAFDFLREGDLEPVPCFTG